MTGLHCTFSWRALLLVTACLLTLTLLLPVMLNHDTSLEITLANERGALPDGFYIYQSLDERGIRIKSITPAKDSLVILLESPEQALAAQNALRDLLPADYAISQRRQFYRWHWLTYLHDENAQLG
ncbi:EnvZ/OmpR regulon moderator MzrA [Acerihabitans sp. TG2]|uniref:EnvZ/OmpR regulon moderator MzrA n=1 Tax=Acerihabitans sp. TG2 TaxID=3096008 RepID=UPI002B23C3CA|nr:EnvZ/OmpR regulon moderator MzrA [Acerihabitans sp. TG2]MEA9390388.1 EnvZ/OmpR regulon moderator MzrA [Acerihabitans sp. TG2]